MPGIESRKWRRRSIQASSPTTEFDLSVPALILKIGQYPIASGPLAAIRTLGRVGVPVFALTEPGPTPAGASRYCTARFTWRTTARDDISAVAGKLRDVGQTLGARSLLVPLDDDSAVLIAENAASLADYFLFPQVAPTLPRRLASKAGLRELCHEFGVPAPVSAVPKNIAELADFASKATFPLVVKNAEVWGGRNVTHARLGSSSSGPRLVWSPDALLGLVTCDDDASGLLVQEYIPAEHAEDWSVHLYADAEGDCRPIFTGRKVRAWPPVAGVTACGISVENPVLAQTAWQFCKSIGYCGVADMDWRFDHRDGQYKLLDFNPRVGHNFRMFVTDQRIDVVRALHLSLTGRQVPHGGQVDGRRLVVEHIDLPARLTDRVSRRRPAGVVDLNAAHGAPTRTSYTSTEHAWSAADDLLPVVAMLSRVISLMKIIWHGLQARRLNEARKPTPAARTGGRVTTAADENIVADDLPMAVPPRTNQARVP